jgi:lysine 2,3-aminomutase
MRALIGAPDDPVGLQFVPDARELVVAAHESGDPIADEALSPVKGVVHRYPDRALLKPLLACPVYCRFCFRREHVGPDGGVLTEAELEAAYAWFEQRPQVREVILTGGDPLMLSPRRRASGRARDGPLDVGRSPRQLFARVHAGRSGGDPARSGARRAGARPIRAAARRER